MSSGRQPTGVERTFDEHEIIVSKTDRNGRLTYANDVFLRVSGYSEAELMGQPHSIIRHPEMPRAVFKLLWDSIQSGREIFAYVNNMARNGDNYWVLAHVTPSVGPTGEIIGFHSNRRVPDPEALRKVIPLYKELLAIEERTPGKLPGVEAAHAALRDRLAQTGMTYDEFVFSLSPAESEA